MLSAQIVEEALTGIALTVVLAGAVLPANDLRADRDHLAPIRMDKGAGQHLQVILHGAVAFFLGEAVVGTNPLRGMKAGAVNGQQQMSVQHGHAGQDLASLQAMEHRAERAAQQ